MLGCAVLAGAAPLAAVLTHTRLYTGSHIFFWSCESKIELLGLSLPHAGGTGDWYIFAFKFIFRVFAVSIYRNWTLASSSRTVIGIQK